MSDEPQSIGGGGANRFQFWASALLIIAFVVLFVVMVESIGTTEVRWARLTYLFGSAEAVVFAAVGWVFGREVNRQRAENAEAEANANASREREAHGRAVSAEERGAALAGALRAQSPTARRKERGEERLAGTAQEPPPSPVDIAPLIRLADELFPESPPGNRNA